MERESDAAMGGFFLFVAGRKMERGTSMKKEPNVLEILDTIEDARVVALVQKIAKEICRQQARAFTKTVNELRHALDGAKSELLKVKSHLARLQR